MVATPPTHSKLFRALRRQPPGKYSFWGRHDPTRYQNPSREAKKPQQKTIPNLSSFEQGVGLCLAAAASQRLACCYVRSYVHGLRVEVSTLTVVTKRRCLRLRTTATKVATWIGAGPSTRCGVHLRIEDKRHLECRSLCSEARRFSTRLNQLHSFYRILPVPTVPSPRT